MRILKMMADYQCFPLWEASDTAVGNVDPASLPISQELIGQLNSWAAEFDRSLNLDDPVHSGFSTVTEERAFLDQGRRLSMRLNEELGKGYSVVYDQDTH